MKEKTIFTIGLEKLLTDYEAFRKEFSGDYAYDEVTVRACELDAFVKRIRELEAENADLRNQLRDAQERC